MPFFFYEKNFANRWIPKLTAEKPREGEAGIDTPPVRSPIHEVSIPVTATAGMFWALQLDFPPPKDSSNETNNSQNR